MWQELKKAPTWVKWLLGIATVLIVIAIVASDEEEEGKDEAVKSAQETKPAEPKAPPEATEAKDTDEANGGGEEKPKGDPEVDENTRAYLNKINVCQISVGLVLVSIDESSSDLELADNTTQARDTCESVKDELLRADTDHFDNEAATGYHAVDRYKSGLNAMLAYIDNPRPSKLIEARDKLQEGDQSAGRAQREINQRRRAYGLKRYKP